jgi:hypothetical protein
MKKGAKEDPKKTDTAKGAAKQEAAPEAEEIKEIPQSGHGKFEYIN